MSYCESLLWRMKAKGACEIADECDTQAAAAKILGCSRSSIDRYHRAVHDNHDWEQWRMRHTCRILDGLDTLRLELRIFRKILNNAR